MTASAKEERKDARRCFVMGAGSSADVGGPLIADFLVKAIEVAGKEDVFPNASAKRAFERALNTWRGKFSDQNIEEFYVLIDLIHRLRPQSRTTKLLEGTQYLISKTLQISLGTQVSNLHKRFISLVGDKAMLITLNWDLVLDNAILAAAGDVDYCREGMTLSASPEQASFFKKPLRLAKLHGSFNWWSCTSQDCGHATVIGPEKGIMTYWEAPGNDIQCAACGKPVKPAIVPPTSQKFEASALSPLLTDIWQEARLQLNSARDVIFVGYSFPPTDLQFKLMAIEALNSNKALERVTIITSPKYGTERAEFEDRIAKIFLGTRARNSVQFEYAGFREWVNDEFRPSDLENQIEDLEWRLDDLEDRID